MTGGVMAAISCNPFSDNKMFLFCFHDVFLAIVTKRCLESLPRDVFLWFANFPWVDLLCIRIETGYTFLGKIEETGFCICGKAILTLGE